MSWFRLRKDDETRRVLAREVSRSSGVKKHQLTQELEEFDRLRVNPLPFPTCSSSLLLRTTVRGRIRAETGVSAAKKAAHEGAQETRVNRSEKSQGLQRKCSLEDQPGGAQREAKREKDEDAAEARLAVAAMDAIETKRCTETLNEDQQLLCEPLLAYFESKVFPREVSAAYLRYWRAGPAALELLRIATEKRQHFSVLWCLARAFARPRRVASVALGSASASGSSRRCHAPSKPTSSHTHDATPRRPNGDVPHTPSTRRSHAGKENRADLCYAFRCRQRMWQTWRAYIAKEKQLKKKLAKEEKERLKRAKENAKKRASRAAEGAGGRAKEAAAAEKRSKEPPKPKKRRAFAAGDVSESFGHMIEEEKWMGVLRCKTSYARLVVER